MTFRFPLPRPYTGVHLANGTQGVLVWGVDRLCLSIGRTGFWDRRGALPFTTRIRFSEVRALIEAGDKVALKAAFANPPGALPYRTPTQLPGGRLELTFKDRAVPVTATLEPENASLSIFLSDGGRLVLAQDPTSELLYLNLHENARIDSIRLVPAWDSLGEKLTSGGVQSPRLWMGQDCGGFHQILPEDPGLAIAWHLRNARTLVLATALDSAPNAGDAAARARQLCAEADLEASERDRKAWWARYWADVPRVRLPDPGLQRHWDYGLWKQAGLTPPQGVAATLQGAWMADGEFPPWSNDYHFNINAQMIYWPALPTNRPDHFSPLWRMLASWLPDLRENARKFFDADDALMLPHAVDDRCRVIGNFWQGTIDQACTAWMAQLAWLHYRHTLDLQLLRDIAWPLLKGAFGGFWAMTERLPNSDGSHRLSLPVSVSPEFGDAGRDASFQLAAFHCIASILPEAARLLGEETDPRWAQVTNELPRATTHAMAKVWGEQTLRPRIGLWQGMDLPESHRHHSHLAGIYPFLTLDPFSETDRDLVKRSIERWVESGPGNWVGWSMPWAAMIWARTGNASAAVTTLRIWEDVFTNLGGGTLHNADSPGYSGWIHGPYLDGPDASRSHDQMQMDASMGYLQAIAEILVQQRGDTLHILPDIPKQWRNFSFDGIRTQGAFLAGATVMGGSVTELRIQSLAGAPLRLALPKGEWRTQSGGTHRDLLTTTPAAGATLTLENRRAAHP